jgi:hypothetical protein
MFIDSHPYAGCLAGETDHRFCIRQTSPSDGRSGDWRRWRSAVRFHRPPGPKTGTSAPKASGRGPQPHRQLAVHALCSLSANEPHRVDGIRTTNAAPKDGVAEEKSARRGGEPRKLRREVLTRIPAPSEATLDAAKLPLRRGSALPGRPPSPARPAWPSAPSWSDRSSAPGRCPAHRRIREKRLYARRGGSQARPYIERAAVSLTPGSAQRPLLRRWPSLFPGEAVAGSLRRREVLDVEHPHWLSKAGFCGPAAS